MKLLVSQKHRCPGYWIWLKRAIANCWKLPSDMAQRQLTLAGVAVGQAEAALTAQTVRCHSGCSRSRQIPPGKRPAIQGTQCRQACLMTMSSDQEGTFNSRRWRHTEWICFFKHPSLVMFFLTMHCFMENYFCLRDTSTQNTKILHIIQWLNQSSKTESYMNNLKRFSYKLNPSEPTNTQSCDNF